MGDTGRVRYPVMDALRIAAALAVVVSHSFALLGKREPRPIAWGPDVSLSLGAVAVVVFFALSGFLVTQSWMSDPHPGRWAARRVTRLWPGLTLVLLVTAYVMGPLVTTWGIGTYLTGSGPASYVAGHLRMTEPAALPGVFDGNHTADPNGSLWTLQTEALSYLLLLALGVLGVIRRRWLLGGVAVGLSLWAWGQDLGLGGLPFYEGGVYQDSLLRLFRVFLLGVLAARLHLRFDWRVAAGCGVFLLASRGQWLSGIGYVALVYVVLWVGTQQWRPVGAVRRLGDPSYGCYLWAWPIQQSLIVAGVSSVPVLIGLAAPLSLAAGYASWHLVERPAIRAVGRRLGRFVVEVGDDEGVRAPRPRVRVVDRRVGGVVEDLHGGR